MAVYTDVPPDALDAFLGQYAIGELRACKGIAEGVENSNFLLTTTQGAFILTLYEKRVKADDLPFFLGLLEHLAARGIRCPTPVKTGAGNALGELCGRPAAIFTFLEGVWVRRPQPFHCAELGEALARFHAAGKGFALTRPNALSIGGFRPLFASSAAGADGVAPGLKSTIEAELAFLEAKWPKGLPEGVIHADLFPDNVFFIGEKLSGLIDFYFACNDSFAYDIAVCLNAWCFEPDLSFNVTKAKIMLARYDAVRKLSSREVRALPVLARGAAIRFLLTRLHDWLHPEPGALVRPKDPLEYAAKLKFHQGVSSAADYGLSA